MEPLTIKDWTDGKQHIPEDNSFPKLDELLEKSKKRLPGKLYICPLSEWPYFGQIITAAVMVVVGGLTFVGGMAYILFFT